MAYKTEIQVKVNGVAQLRDLETTLTRVNALQTRINKKAATKFVNIGRLNSETQAINSLNKALERNVQLQGKVSAARNRQAVGTAGATSRAGNRGAAASQGRGIGPALVGGAFPLLFGGGPGAVVGGFLGELAGPLGGVVGSAVGMQFDALAQKAVDLSKALDPLTADFDTLVQRLGAVNTPLESIIKSYEELEEEQKALEVSTRLLADLVGNDGVKALEEFGKGTVRVQNAFSRLLTQMLALMAEAFNQLPSGFTENIERAVLLGQAEKSADPAIQNLVRQREAARSGSLGRDPRTDFMGFLRGGDPQEFNRLTEEIINKQKESNRLSFDQLTILDDSLKKRIAERDARVADLKVQQSGVRIQLNQLANEQKIFGIRQQAATAGIQLEQARFNAELSTFQLQETRLQRELQGLQKKNAAFNNQKRLVNQIAENQVRQAQIEFEVGKLRIQQNIEQAKAAKQQIDFETRRIKLQIQMLRLKAMEEEDDKRRAARLKGVNAAAKQANSLTSEMVKAANRQLQVAISIGREQEKVANNILKGKIESIEAKRVEAERAVIVRSIAAAAGKAADETARMNSSMSKGPRKGRTASTSMRIDPDVEAAVKASKPMGFRDIFELTKALDEAQMAKNRRTAMSQPGPNSFAGSSAYGVRASFGGGSSTAAVNISTGPVMQFDNEKYVNMKDFELALNQLSRSQATSSRSYAGRTYGGVS